MTKPSQLSVLQETPTQATKRLELARLSNEVEQLCQSLGVGGQLPRHPELMRRFNASERAILGVLDEFRRTGRIVRRHGAGTFVASPPPSRPPVVETRTIIAIRVPDNSFFDHCVDVLFHHVSAAGLSLLCKIVSGDSVDNIPSLPADEVLGFLLFRYDLAPLARQIQAQGGRVVVIGTPPYGATPDVPCVYGDHDQGGYQAVRHLIDLGHRRLLFVTPEADYFRRLRWQGNERALQEANRCGKDIRFALLAREEIAGWHTDPALAAEYFRRPDAPTGVIAWNDDIAMRLIVTFNRAGLRVPEDVSVVGYDALPQGQLIYPPLTTVDPMLEWQLSTALSLLTRPEPPSPSHMATVLPTLLPRDSTAPHGDRAATAQHTLRRF